MTLVFAAAMPQPLTRPSRLAALWARLTGGAALDTRVGGGADDRLMFELERLAEVSPHLLADLGFVEIETGVFERRIWSLGNVTVAVDADGAANAWVTGAR